MFYELEYHQLGKDALYNTHHSHADRLEIIQSLVDGGQVLIRDTLYPMAAGCVYLIDATETHCTAPKDVESYLRNKIIVSEESMLKAAQSLGMSEQVESLFFGSGGKYCALSAEQAQRADSLFKSICENYRYGIRGDIFLLWADFFQLLSLLCAKRATGETGADLIDKILTYINDNISEKLTLEGISKHLHIDKFYMCHYFKDKTSMTVMDYISDRRITMAKRLLLSTGLSITEIAVKCGYSSASYFTQVFKKETEKTPVAFRSEPYHEPNARKAARTRRAGKSQV